MGFILNFCLIKYICSIGIVRIDGGETVENVEMDAKSRKAMHLINIIKQKYRELTLTARDAGEFLGRWEEINWENGEEDLVEWSERNGTVCIDWMSSMKD